MPTYPQPQLSPLEKLRFILKIFRALSNGFLALLTSPFRGTAGAAKLGNHIKIAILRSLTKNTTVREIQSAPLYPQRTPTPPSLLPANLPLPPPRRWLAPPLSTAYSHYAQTHSFTPTSLSLPTTKAQACFLGPPTARKTLLWFHGGGYNLPPDPLHLSFCDTLTSPTLSVLMLEYTLAPHATYPTQLKEAVELVHTLVNEKGMRPEDISFGGDSAGGNLALGVLSHILHPHPEIPVLDLKGGTLGAILLVAPWASFSHDWPSVTDSARKDVVGAADSDRWSSAFLGEGTRDAYNEPLSLASAEGEAWFEGMEGVVREVIVTAGSDELLRSSVEELMRRLGKVHPRVECVVAEDEWHDRPFIKVLGGGGVQAEAIRGFVRGKCDGEGEE